MLCNHAGCTEDIGLEDFLDYCDEHFEYHCMSCGRENQDWDGDGPNICTECQVEEAEQYAQLEEGEWAL